MKKILIGSLITIVLLIGLSSIIVGGYVWWALQPINSTGNTVQITVPSGAGANQVSNILKKMGLVKDNKITSWYFTYKKLDRQIQAGNYTLSTNMSVDEITKKLMSNPAGIKVTLLEGWRREQIADAIEKAYVQYGAEFSKKDFLKLTENLEGRLFPDTYVFSPANDEQKVISTLLENFESKVNTLGIEQPSVDKIVNLAAIIEREAKIPKDKKLVSGVLLNRLNNNMPLQVDATLQYAKANRICAKLNVCPDWWPAPRAEDKELDSEFNTYANSGLPPHPIANPGFTALDAAWNPEPSNFVYYLTDMEGVTHFAKTYDEHLANIEKYLR